MSLDTGHLGEDEGVPAETEHNYAEDPFTPQERRRLRKLLAEDAHATWLRRKIRVFTPWAVAAVSGAIALYNFVIAQIKH